MNILYITSRAIEINASSSIRNIATIKELIELGNQVAVCSMRPDITGRYFDEDTAKLNIERIYFESNLDGAIRAAKRFNIFQTKLYRFLRGKRIYDGSRQIVNHVGEIDTSRYDVIISSSDPKTSHLFVESLIDKCGIAIPWIQIWGDPFASDMTINGSKRYLRKIAKEEYRLLSKCDSIIYVSEATLKSQKENYPDFAEKMHYLPIPYLKSVTDKEQDDNTVEAKNSRKIKLAYCGDYLSKTRNIVPLYEAVKNSENYSLRVCGDSDVQLDSTDSIQLSGRVPYKEVCKIEEDADILVLICNLFGTQIPGKIYQYSGTNKAILFILDGDKKSIKQQFMKYARYEFCNNDAEDIKQKLREICQNKKKYLPVKEFEPCTVADQILASIKI